MSRPHPDEVYRSMSSADVVQDRRSIMKKIRRIKQLRKDVNKSNILVDDNDNSNKMNRYKEDDINNNNNMYNNKGYHNEHSPEEIQDPGEVYDCLEQSIRSNLYRSKGGWPLEGEEYNQKDHDQHRKHKNNSPNETVIYPTVEHPKKRLISIVYIMIVIAIIFTFVFFLEATKMSPYAVSGVKTSDNRKNDPSTPLTNTPNDGFTTSNNYNTNNNNKYSDGNNMSNSNGVRSRSSARPETKEEQHSERVVAFRSILGPAVTPLDKLDNMGTPQYRALHWLANADRRKLALPTNAMETQKLIQRYVLALIYYSTHGENWRQQLNFLSINDECEWNQIFDGGYFSGAGVCDDSDGGKDGHGFITTIALWNNNLHGTIPDEIGYLHKLKVFSASNNELYGELPPHMNFLDNLERVFIQKNKITGVLSFICDNPSLNKFHSDCNDPSVQCECCEICCNTEKNECKKRKIK